MTADEGLGREALREVTLRERAALDELVASMTAQQIADARMPDGHSVKDLLGHIAAWERRVTVAMETWMRGNVPAWPEPAATMEDMDLLNDRDFTASARAPLADAFAESTRAHAALLRLIDVMPEEALLAPGGPWPWPLSLVVRANADQHYREHANAIGAWLAGGGAS
ncbi:MAG: ClbS/DfsB family four-helix bundle protein [Chloroflexi bacterium]|nr:ClbS/DfsB family four-helix bundle protein [Chloroflexota bacterium]